MTFFIYYHFMKIIIYFLLLFPLMSCNDQNKNRTYYKNREFTYQVMISQDSILTEEREIKLKVSAGLRAKIMTGGQIGIQYTYMDIKDPKTKKSLIETTGAIDNGERVFIHPPRMAYMEFAEIPPMPDIRRKTSVGVNSEGVLDGIKGHGDLDGLEIKQVDTVVAKKNVTLLGKDYNDVWIIKGENTNYLDELGKYKATYWFDQNYGFIRMKYEKPNGEIVDIKLKSTED